MRLVLSTSSAPWVGRILGRLMAISNGGTFLKKESMETERVGVSQGIAQPEEGAETYAAHTPMAARSWVFMR